MTENQPLRLTPLLLERFNYFENGPVEHQEEGKMARAFYGVLYGVRVKEVSEHPIIMNCTGNPIFQGEEVKEDINVEFLSELFPIGLDPVGILYLSCEDNVQEKTSVLMKLVESLPDGEAFAHDPVVMTKSANNAVESFLFSEGEFKM